MTRFHSALIRGELAHARADEFAHRAFRYPVYMAALDPIELPALDRDLALFSLGRRNVFAFDARDYTTRHAELLAGNSLAAPAHVRLITNLRVLGYVFNPVSFFLGYDATDVVTSVIAEVNNTFGGNRAYVLGPAQRIADPRGRGRACFRHVRELFVSPFLHGEVDYEFYVDAPLDGARLAIAMKVFARPRTDGERAVFVAQFAGDRVVMSDRALLAAALRYPLMTAQVTGLIHWQALRLRLAGVPYRRPRSDHRPLPHTQRASMG